MEPEPPTAGLSSFNGSIPGMGAFPSVPLENNDARRFPSLDYSAFPTEPGPFDLDGNSHPTSLPKIQSTMTVYRKPGRPDPDFGNGMLLFCLSDPQQAKRDPQVSCVRSLSSLNHFLFSDDPEARKLNASHSPLELMRRWKFVGFQVVSPDDQFTNESYADLTVSHAGISPFLPNIWLAADPDVAEMDHLWLLVMRCTSHSGRNFWTFAPHVRRSNDSPSTGCVYVRDGTSAFAMASIYIGQVYAIYNETTASASSFGAAASQLAFPTSLPVESDSLDIPFVQVFRPVC